MKYDLGFFSNSFDNQKRHKKFVVGKLYILEFFKKKLDAINLYKL